MMMDEREHRRRAIAHLKSALRYERRGLPAKARAHFGRAMHYGFGTEPSELPKDLIEMIVKYTIDGSTEVSGGVLAAAIPSLRQVKVDVGKFLEMRSDEMRKHTFYPFYICTVQATARKSTYQLLWKYDRLVTEMREESMERKGIVEALRDLRIMIVEYWYHMCPYRFHDLVEILHAEGTPDKIRNLCSKLLEAFFVHLDTKECTECKILKRPEIKREIREIINKTITPNAVEITHDMVDAGRGISGLVVQYEANPDEIKPRYGHLCVWKTGGVKDMRRVFDNRIWNDNEWDVRLWDTRIVSDMSYAFSRCGGLLSGVERWSVGGVSDMSNMFSQATSFNRDISSWDTGNVVNMSSMFEEAASFNQDIGNWDTSKVENMGFMFYRASVFNRDIGEWDTSKVASMESMFSFASSFNKPIGKWNTSSVKNMSSMFSRSGSFDQPVGKWDTSKVTDMSGMFYEANAFNRDIGGWNTREVQDMSVMFYGASAFNQDISRWDMSKVDATYRVDRMLDRATAMEPKNKPPVTIQP